MSTFENRFRLSRRDLLAQTTYGVGMIGLASVLAGHSEASVTPLAARPPHFPARAKRIIHLWMNGGPSQVDTFDPKPALQKYAGQRPESTIGLTTQNGTGGLMPSPFRFTRHGQSGLEISELFPHVARHADDLCVIRSMHTNTPVHEASNWLMFTGNVQPIRPAYGSWLLYGLGTENENLPGFIVLGEGQPVNGPSNWSSRFLPGIYQGCQVVLPGDYRPENALANLHNASLSLQGQRRELDFTQRLNDLHRERVGAENAFGARMDSMELAYRMQISAAEAFDSRGESQQILDLYGLTGLNAGAPPNAKNDLRRTTFARNCLLARRLAERGVRVIQIYYGNQQPWDTHGNNSSAHQSLAGNVDQPIAGLLTDLKQRGLLEDTLVVWGGEFGRTPTTQGSNGRDHNHYGFSMWLAGGGVRGGLAYGATDEFGFKAVENRVHVHDLHATMLHLMGLDHEKLTYRYSGRDYRLTDVHGEVIRDILV
ncbi:hypothetical protein ETAA8_16550 [Anatilimnocola aggregata]|uniref:DUF1501 domain-containing protein n=1 Tax=Anatilimnocola aggregata TaxID=2528021 RepID=A0A517Y8N8_9BACT|nr:DUF1501 domain-containing protein [Anatilimnocola aggregata]QDU26575.1 hypothetical protein ETAA8_16550 [Anatilimnocola aggregata]